MKRLLVVVDMQNDFLTGSLKNKQAVQTIPAIIKTIKQVDCVLFTRDTHYKDYKETLEGQYFNIVHCLDETWGHQVEQSLLDCADSTGKWWDYLDKSSFGPDWTKFDLSPEIDEVIFCGTPADTNLISTVLSFRNTFPDVPIAVMPKGCSGTTPEALEAAFTIFKNMHFRITNKI